jgi:hypothetical protein
MVVKIRVITGTAEERYIQTQQANENMCQTATTSPLHFFFLQFKARQLGVDGAIHGTIGRISIHGIAFRLAYNGEVVAPPQHGGRFR